MRAHFPGNADQILDFFASLVSRRLSEGRRPLLIAKKRFVEPLRPYADLHAGGDPPNARADRDRRLGRDRPGGA